jgi:hypothetical protein
MGRGFSKMERGGNFVVEPEWNGLDVQVAVGFCFLLWGEPGLRWFGVVLGRWWLWVWGLVLFPGDQRKAHERWLAFAGWLFS